MEFLKRFPDRPQALEIIDSFASLSRTPSIQIVPPPEEKKEIDVVPPGSFPVSSRQSESPSLPRKDEQNGYLSASLKAHSMEHSLSDISRNHVCLHGM